MFVIWWGRRNFAASRRVTAKGALFLGSPYLPRTARNAAKQLRNASAPSFGPFGRYAAKFHKISP